MPSPSVTLCSTKPTTRYEASAAAPVTSALPTTSPSPRLCRPIPSAMNPASATPRGATPPRRPSPSSTVGGEQRRDPDQRLAAQPAERRGAELQPLVQRVDQQVDQQPDGQRQHEAPRARPGPAQRRVGHQPDRHRREPEQQPDQRQPGQRTRRQSPVSPGRPRSSSRTPAPVPVSSRTWCASPSTQGNGMSSRAVPSRPIGASGVRREAAPGAVDLHLRDRDRRRAVGAHAERDQPRRQPRRLDRQLLDRRRGAGQLAQRLAEQQEADHRHQQPGRQRQRQPRPHHTTSKWLIQPSSANSDWWAWNM